MARWLEPPPASVSLSRASKNFRTNRFFESRTTSHANLDQSLIQNRIRHLHEPGDIRAIHQVARMTILFGGIKRVLVDGDHDLVQPVVHFFARPSQPHAVLAHLKSAGGHTL